MKILLIAALVVALASLALYASLTVIPAGSVGLAGAGPSAAALAPGIHLGSPFADPPIILPLRLPTVSGEGTVTPTNGATYEIAYEISGRIDPARIEDFQRARGDGEAGDLLVQAAGGAIMRTLEGEEVAFLASAGMQTGARLIAHSLLEPAGIVDVTFEIHFPNATLLQLAKDLVRVGKASILRQLAAGAVAGAAPGDWEPHTALGLVLEGEMDLKGAESRYLDALSIQPTAIPPMAQLFALYSAVGELEKLDRLLTAALEVAPESVQHLTWLSASLMRQGREEEAMRPAEDALALEPDDTRLINNLAGIHLKLGQFQEAIRLLRKAFAASGEDRQTRLNLGVALAATGEFKEGLEHLLAAEKLGNPGPPLLWAVAKAYRGLGQGSRAAAYERKARDAEKAKPS